VGALRRGAKILEDLTRTRIIGVKPAWSEVIDQYERGSGRHNNARLVRGDARRPWAEAGVAGR
jgi:hypothetical protein